MQNYDKYNQKISTTEPNMIVEIQIWKIDADIPI
jgi:hypothetical protein